MISSLLYGARQEQYDDIDPPECYSQSEHTCLHSLASHGANILFYHIICVHFITQKKKLIGRNWGNSKEIRYVCHLHLFRHFKQKLLMFTVAKSRFVKSFSFFTKSTNWSPLATKKVLMITLRPEWLNFCL